MISVLDTYLSYNARSSYNGELENLYLNNKVINIRFTR